MDSPGNLSDNELLERIELFAKEERERLPLFLACLGEADRRRLPEKLGYSSTFDYCVRRLNFSEDESYRRIQAATAAQSRPEILSALSDGQLSLTAVSKIAPHVHRDDAPDIIARAEGKSTREIVEMLAPLCPEPLKRDRIRTISIASPAMSPSVELNEGYAQGSDAEVKVALEVLPVVGTPDVADLKLERLTVEVAESAVDVMVQTFADQQKNYEDAPAKHKAAMGDLVVMDFHGKVACRSMAARARACRLRSAQAS